MKTNKFFNRPRGFSGKADNQFQSMADNLISFINTIEKKFTTEKLIFETEEDKAIFAGILTGFAEDLHCGLGFWDYIEEYNAKNFGSPLPLFLMENNKITEMFDKTRIKYLLYNLVEIYLKFPDVSPENEDLEIFASNISEYFNRNIKRISKDSGLKKFLATHNDTAWDFKNKLVWLGSSFYLYSLDYIKDIELGFGDEVEVNVTRMDEFVCKSSTTWSGLGMTELLAGVLKLPANIQAEVSKWHDKLFGLYQVISMSDLSMDIKNIHTDKIYSIYAENPQKIFSLNLVYLGALVTYDSKYYWTGSQALIGKVDSDYVKELKLNFSLDDSHWVYRFDKELLKKAQEIVTIQYDNFLEYFGDDYIIFDSKTEFNTKYKKCSLQLQKKLFPDEDESKDNLIPLQGDVLSKNDLGDDYKIALFFNKILGQEIWELFDEIESGFAKQGVNLSVYEIDMIIDFIIYGDSSPDFVKKLVSLYGVKSIQVAFELDINNNDLEYLLHKYKSPHYKVRYPKVTIKN